MILYYIILIFFAYLFISHFTSIKEGFDEETPTQFTTPNLNDDPMVLAKTNAANINYLKTQIDSISDLKQQIVDISGVVHTNSINIKQFGKEMSDQMINMSGQVAVASNCKISPTSNDCSRVLD